MTAPTACHAIVGTNRLEPFEARILDLAGIFEPRTMAELEEGGRALAEAPAGDAGDREESPGAAR